MTDSMITFLQESKGQLTAISLQADMDIPVPSICFNAYSLMLLEANEPLLKGKYKCHASQRVTMGAMLLQNPTFSVKRNAYIIWDNLQH